MTRWLAALALLGSTAHASVFDMYGFGARGRALGNAQTAAVDDHTATFYNPGALTRRKTLIVGAGFVLTRPDVGVDRRPQAEHQREITANLPEGFTGLHLGAVFPLGGLIDNRVALGLGLYLPLFSLLQAGAVDAQVPQFYRYETLPDKFVVLASLAFEATDWLSLGAGVQVLASLDGGITLDLDLANRRVTQRALEVDIDPRVAPTAGILLTPTDRLRIGASVRGALQLDYALPSSLRIDELVVLDVDIRGTVLFTPTYLNLGVAYCDLLPGLLLSGDFAWARWSQAPSPAPVFTLDVQGELPESLGLGERLDTGNGAAVALAFRDVPIVRVGAEYQLPERWQIRAGYTWRPSPAPVPTETFNYIDNDAHVVALGAGVAFADPLEIQRNPVTVDVVYQASILSSLAVRKRAGADDPVGDYTAGGVIHSLGISLRHDL